MRPKLCHVWTGSNISKNNWGKHFWTWSCTAQLAAAAAPDPATYSHGAGQHGWKEDGGATTPLIHPLVVFNDSVLKKLIFFLSEGKNLHLPNSQLKVTGRDQVQQLLLFFYSTYMTAVSADT